MSVSFVCKQQTRANRHYLYGRHLLCCWKCQWIPGMYGIYSDVQCRIERALDARGGIHNVICTRWYTER